MFISHFYRWGNPAQREIKLVQLHQVRTDLQAEVASNRPAPPHHQLVFHLTLSSIKLVFSFSPVHLQQRGRECWRGPPLHCPANLCGGPRSGQRLVQRCACVSKATPVLRRSGPGEELGVGDTGQHFPVFKEQHLE